MLQELTSVPNIKTIEDRNDWAVRMADNYHIPRYNWTIDEITGDITVNALGPTLPSSVNLWHSTTCDSLRRDFRYFCLSTGFVNAITKVKKWHFTLIFNFGI